MLSLRKLNAEETSFMERRQTEKDEQITLKKEEPEVEYKRRLIERFSYKNTDMIKRIYAENQVCNQ